MAEELTEERWLLIQRNAVLIAEIVDMLNKLSADKDAYHLYQRREKARRDMVMRGKWALKQHESEIYSKT